MGCAIGQIGNQGGGWENGQAYIFQLTRRGIAEDEAAPKDDENAGVDERAGSRLWTHLLTCSLQCVRLA
ncbi:hypothetical protein AAHC03_0777 [Spirometra sp. Aus1]